MTEADKKRIEAEADKRYPDKDYYAECCHNHGFQSGAEYEHKIAYEEGVNAGVKFQDDVAYNHAIDDVLERLNQISKDPDNAMIATEIVKLKKT